MESDVLEVQSGEVESQAPLFWVSCAGGFIGAAGGVIVGAIILSLIAKYLV